MICWAHTAIVVPVLCATCVLWTIIAKRMETYVYFHEGTAYWMDPRDGGDTIGVRYQVTTLEEDRMTWTTSRLRALGVSKLPHADTIIIERLRDDH